ncbi:hypothetical protein Tco_0880676 [Tanacetum coccineum]
MKTKSKLLPKCNVMGNVGQTGTADVEGSCLNGNQQVNSTGVGMCGISGCVTVSKRQRVRDHVNDVVSDSSIPLCQTRKRKLDSRFAGNSVETSGTNVVLSRPRGLL